MFMGSSSRQTCVGRFTSLLLFRVYTISINLSLVAGPSVAVSLQTPPDLNSPVKLITRPIQEKEHLRFLEETVPQFFRQRKYTFAWAGDENERIAQLQSPELTITEGWDKGAVERVTFQVRIEEVRENRQLRYKFYLTKIRIEKKGGYRPKWRAVDALEGEDPEPSLVQALQQEFVPRAS